MRVEESNDGAEARIALSPFEFADRVAMQAGRERLGFLAPPLTVAERMERPTEVEHGTFEYDGEVWIIAPPARLAGQRKSTLAASINLGHASV